MGALVAIAVVIALIIAILDALDFIYIGIIDFFVHSIWGIITFFIGILSLVFFYASSRSYKDLKTNEAFLHNPRQLRKKDIFKEGSMSGEHSAQVNEFDLSSITMETLVRKMAFEMTKPGPIFFKGWGNRRLELDVERVRILGTYVEELRSTGSSLMELNADAALSYEKIEKLTRIKRNELDEKLKRSEVNLDFVAEEHKHRVRKMELDNAEQEARIRIMNAQAQEIEMRGLSQQLTAKGEYKMMIAKSKKDKKIASVLSEGAKYYKDLTPVLKSYVVAQLGSENNQNPSTDMDMHEELKKFIVRKQQAETRKMEYEAEERKEQTETQKEKLKRERERYKKNGI
jgi:hypothetical protein